MNYVEALVLRLGWVRSPQTTVDNSLSHLPGALSFSLYNLFFNASRIMPLALSTYPLALGCATDMHFTTILLSSQKS
jgi:hypothetical protein